MFPFSVSAVETQHAQSSQILHDLASFRQMGSVLYIAAHPDDENTELLAYLSRGRNYRTAYLSLTRGDGGQNVLGADLGDKLGVARTQELLAARHIDGAQQFFSRARDFGFSKSYSETLNVWDRQGVLSDIVRVIRQFHPDVLITRFSPNPGGTHGHHTASAVLAMEAFKLAGDPSAFPEQGLAPWQPKRILWNVSTFQRDKGDPSKQTKIVVDGKDLVTGDTFVDIAGASRAMHKTQGFDSFRITTVSGKQREEAFELLDGAPMTGDIMDGVDTTWNRVAGGEAIGKAADEIIAHFKPENAAASVPELLKLRGQLTSMQTNDLVVKEKRAQLDRIVEECLGLKVETTIAHCDVVPGEAMKLHQSVTIANVPAGVPIRWTAVRYPQIKKEIGAKIDLHTTEPKSLDTIETLPTKTPVTQPWWLRKEGTPGMFDTDDATLIGTAENAPAFPVDYIFEIGGNEFTISDEPIQFTTNPDGIKIRRRLDVIPPVSLRFISDVALMAPGGSHSVEVEVRAARADSSGTLQLEAPSDWKVSAKHSFHLNKVGEHADFKFTITAPSHSATAKITARADVDGISYRNQREQINYPHLPPQLLQPNAALTAVSLDLATRAHTVGYLPGAGDTIAENMKEMGCEVKTLDDTNLTAEQLRGLDAVVIGVRAFNVRENIGKAIPALFEYVQNGGTMIVQYNRPDKLKSEKVAPFDLHISSDRVTDEKATMTFLEPESPVLNVPNKITSADFDGWVQERGLYFPNKWDEHFTPILACNDAGEAPMKGSLLVAKYGKGYYVYTGLGFFRQLPAGVPGAYRLFANLLSIGK